MWNLNERGEKEFKGGSSDWGAAAQTAKECPWFDPDDEDEMIAEEPVSCYNCRFRRWTPRSFTCCKNTLN